MALIPILYYDDNRNRDQLEMLELLMDGLDLIGFNFVIHMQ